jgi:hypothetical protein
MITERTGAILSHALLVRRVRRINSGRATLEIAGFADLFLREKRRRPFVEV